MCGILGVWREEGINGDDLNKIRDLIRLNSKRGTMGFGYVTPSHYETNLGDPLSYNWYRLEDYIGEKYILVHLRSPTGAGKNTLYVTQPNLQNDSILLFNGLLLGWDDGIFETDTFQLHSILKESAFKKLETIKGSYAFAFVQNSELWLVRCINSLFYDDNFFSSVKFDGAKELLHGEVMNFKSKKTEQLNLYTPYSI